MVDSTLVSNAIVISYVGGIKPDGKDIIKSQKINKLRTNMTDEDIFAVGKAIMSLMVDQVVELRKSLEYSLVEG